MTTKLKDESDKYYQAARRLDILASGNAFRDLFAVDVYYHIKWYSGFTYTCQLREPFTENREVEDKFIDCFFRKIELRVLKDKEAFILTELLLDLKDELRVRFGFSTK